MSRLPGTFNVQAPLSNYPSAAGWSSAFILFTMRLFKGLALFLESILLLHLPCIYWDVITQSNGNIFKRFPALIRHMTNGNDRTAFCLQVSSCSLWQPFLHRISEWPIKGASAARVRRIPLPLGHKVRHLTSLRRKLLSVRGHSNVRGLRKISPEKTITKVYGSTSLALRGGVCVKFPEKVSRYTLMAP